MLFVPLLAALVATQAPPVTAGAPPAADEVVVTARLRERVDQLVRLLTDAPVGGQLARWNDAICPRVVGVDEPHATFLRDRIVAAARRAKVMVAGARCAPNVIVVITDLADEFATALVQRHPRLFRDPLEHGLAPRREREALKQSRPVRWLHGTLTMGADGQRIDSGTVNATYSMSRIKRTTRRDIALAIMVVDATRIGGATWDQLGDYLAMVALAQPKLGVTFTADTILSLFNYPDPATQAPAGLTPQDQALLAGIYAAAPDYSIGQQRGTIARFVQRTTPGG